MTNKLPHFNVCHLNINSLYQKLSELENLAEELNIQVLCISEHWLKEEQVPTSNISGYECAAIFCRTHFSHGGVAIYTKRGQLSNKELDLSDLISEKVFEAVCIICDNFAVICVYRSPSGDINEFCDRLDQCIQRVITKKNHLIICGDINVDILNYQQPSDLDGKKFIYILEENGLHSITDKSTRVTHSSKSAIDHIITNLDKNNYESVCDLETGFSDHYMQCISIKQEKKKFPCIMKRMFTTRSKANFCRALQDQNWEAVFKESDVNGKYNTFHNIFKELYDTHFPIKKVREKREDKSGISTGIKITSKNFRDLCLFIKTTNNPILLSYFRRYRLIYRQVIKKAKCLHNQRIVMESKNKSKTIWSIVNDSIGKAKQERKNLNIMGEDGNVTNDPEKVSDIFNNYYYNVINDLQKENNGIGTKTRKHCDKSMFLRSVTRSEIINAIVEFFRKI
ncbi:LOW QUALITY PROTEIN: Exodeoxyribonuclease III [Frankliniella fusca]|uniref:Exodeoxyribonuclease III n=1 Tax=Frankliniella fusca TaxID=407009 RepID=A0AAE1H3Q2_9NEOP|nr:LOW QUALITY PROTEIN: Exodeoxyribonuclease III [Frankliniella fusca]